VWTLAVGSKLPPGLSLHADGTLSGVPLFADEYKFIVTANGETGIVAAQEISMTINARQTSNAIAPTVVISKMFAARNEEVTVQFRVYNNPGFSNMVLRVDIPEDLTLLRYESHPLLRDFEYGSENGSEFFGWIGSTENFAVQGAVLAMTFAVNTDAENGFKEISAAFESHLGKEFPFDENRNELLDFEIANGGVFVREFMRGDADGDGRVTSADATLLARWLIDSTTVIDLDAADLTGKGVGLFTLSLLARWLVGHDISVHL